MDNQVVIRVEGSNLAALRAILARPVTVVALGYNDDGTIFMVAQ